MLTSGTLTAMYTPALSSNAALADEETYTILLGFPALYFDDVLWASTCFQAGHTRADCSLKVGLLRRVN